MLGPGAAFRPGQWEAIEAMLGRGERVLVVQRTGWGKSLVYFLATRLLREQGRGPTLLVSPLLSLMRNQIAAAERVGVRACTINSDNRLHWDAVEAALDGNECDILLVSPERLGRDRFFSGTLARLQGRVGMLAIDEAHCISDWGHDFRPDYRRIRSVLEKLPSETAVLATTATANARVIDDIRAQLGPGLTMMRGELARSSLSLNVMPAANQAGRLAWLADQIPRLPGSGIIYCQTVNDCRRVSDWLLSQGIAAPPYYSALEEYRPEREELLLQNRVKALVATVALGMGFDKPDLGFVIHYHRPGSAIAYYQQVGRAGRGLSDATVVLLQGEDDDEVHDYFISSAFPAADEMWAVLRALEEQPRRGLTESQLLDRVNVSPGALEKILSLLQVDGAVEWGRDGFRCTNTRWSPDEERVRRVTEIRREELAHMRAYSASSECRMLYLTRELDDPADQRCGRCDNCKGRPLAPAIPDTLVRKAREFLLTEDRTIEPRLQWPAGRLAGLEGRLPFPNEPGRALCLYGDGGWGRLVIAGKYRDGRFSDDLVTACAELIERRWKPTPPPEWVTAVPSLRHPDLVPHFAARLAAWLDLPYHRALAQVRPIPEQKEMQNSTQQARNVAGAFRIVAPCPAGPVLLVDDVVDSRWTITIAGHLIRSAGGGRVYPLVLAEAVTRSGAR
jgi:ATP-dependent DNA helicase RecQ